MQPTELNRQATRNLVGFFDVLIQMDFAQKQRNEYRSTEDERRTKNKSS